jgi:hypothetical protein
VDAHIHQTSRKSLNKRLPARKLMETVFWDRKGGGGGVTITK